MTRIELSEKFKSQLRKIKDEAIRDGVEKMFKDLLEDQTIGKPLRYSFKGYRAMRIEKYRLIYAIEGDVVKVYAIKHRKKVYK